MRRHLLFLCLVSSAALAGCSAQGSRDVITPPPVARSQQADPPAPAKTRPKSNCLDALPEQPADAVSGEVAARIRATVNGSPIFDEEVHANAYQVLVAIDSLPEPERSQKRREVLKEVLDQLIERELLIQDAQARLKKAGPNVMKKLNEAADKEFDRRYITGMKKNFNLKSDDDVKDYLRQQGVSFEMVKRQWTQQFISQEYLKNRVLDMLNKIGHEQLVEYYETHADEFKQEDAVEWQDLFVSAASGKYATREAAKQVAEQIVARLRKGENILELCKQYDDGNAVNQEGAGIGRKRGEIQPPDCEEHLFSLRPGDVGPIIELSTGFHVFRLVKREYAGKKPFDEETQKDIHNKLRSAMYEREAKKIVADLKRHAVIEYARGTR